MPSGGEARRPPVSTPDSSEAGSHSSATCSPSLSLTLSQLRGKYGNDGASRYMEVDGVEIHWKDEGPARRRVDEGDHARTSSNDDEPAVLLLHASFLNLSAWHLLVDVVSRRFRVVRLDFPNAGLSGPETKEPSPRADGAADSEGGDRQGEGEGKRQNRQFNLMDRNVEVVKKFCDALELDRFCLVGTSTGAAVGFRFAAAFPERVKRMVLINSAGEKKTKRAKGLLMCIDYHLGGEDSNSLRHLRHCHAHFRSCGY